jgi:hypothetical protein
MLPSLPPILHNAGQNSTPSYSKGPRGLFVLPQLTSIFTRTSISPGLWLRQWGSRYAIRAGQNLPDKEFRSSSSSCRHEARTISSSRRRDEMAGVWPLRIPETETAAGDSSPR